MDGTKVNSMTEPAIPCGSLFDAGSDLRRREPKACLRLKHSQLLNLTPYTQFHEMRMHAMGLDYLAGDVGAALRSRYDTQDPLRR